jgi:hypothetical protein
VSLLPLLPLLPPLLLLVVRRKLLIGPRLGTARYWRGVAKRLAAFLMLLLCPVMLLRLRLKLLEDLRKIPDWPVRMLRLTCSTHFAPSLLLLLPHLLVLLLLLLTPLLLVLLSELRRAFPDLLLLLLQRLSDIFLTFFCFWIAD